MLGQRVGLLCVSCFGSSSEGSLGLPGGAVLAEVVGFVTQEGGIVTPKNGFVTPEDVCVTTERSHIVCVILLQDA